MLVTASTARLAHDFADEGDYDFDNNDGEILKRGIMKMRIGKRDMTPDDEGKVYLCFLSLERGEEGSGRRMTINKSAIL